MPWQVFQMPPPPSTLLQVRHCLRTDFTELLPLGTQYFSLKLARVCATPGCIRVRWYCLMMRVVRHALLGSKIGNLVLIRRFARSSRPWLCKSPSPLTYNRRDWMVLFLVLLSIAANIGVK